MLVKSFVRLAIAGTVIAPVTAAEFTPIDADMIDVGCSYSRSENGLPFLLVLALPPLEGGPRVFLGVDGKDLGFDIEHEGEPTSSFMREGLRLAVHYGEPIEQECGENCAGSKRSVRVELEGGKQSLSVDAIEHCGC